MQDEDLFSVTQVGQCLVVTAGNDLGEQALAQLQRTALAQVSAHGLRAVVLDLAAVQVLDTHEFASLQSTAGMLRLLGAATLFVGLRPAVIAYLMQADVDVSDVAAAPDLGAALDRVAAGHLLRP